MLSTPNGTVVQGVVAGLDGQFQITDIEPGDYKIEVRYIAYLGFELDMTLAAGDVRTVNAVLTQERININTVVVTASRGAEKVLDSPASISVIDAADVQQDVSLSTGATLRNTLGVDLAQTSLDRMQISLRGFNAANTGTVYVLNDYRQPVGSGGLVLYSALPSITLDIDRVEVVRGPASALYGAGGDEGVIHFLTKNPFEYPGTTFSVTAGEQSTFSGEYRHAGVVGDRVGYKVTALYTQADEWQLDPNDALDAFQLSRDAMPRTYDYTKLTVNGMLQYRFGDALSITANTGYSELSGPILTGFSTLQGKGMGTTYAQLRIRANNFFAQGFGNWARTGESFSYITGLPLIQNGARYGAQMQFDLNSPDERTRFIFGADLDHAFVDSEGTISGRFEDADDLTVFGGYAQSSLTLSPKVDFTFTLRGDWSNVSEEFQLSPRAALVFTPMPGQTLRATFNRAFAAPKGTEYFLDLVGQTTPLGPTKNLMVVARGAQGFTFDKFRQTNAARFYLPVDGFFGQDFDVNAMPLLPIYGAAAGNGLVDAIRTNTQAQLTEMQRNLLADLFGFTALQGLLGPGATTSATDLGVPGGEEGFISVDEPEDRSPLKLTTTQTIEAGYKGLLGGSSLLTFDVFYTKKENFIGPQAIVTPFVYLNGEGLSQDVAMALGTVFSTSTDPAVQNLLAGLGATGLSAQQVAGILGGFVGGAFGNQPVAVVQTDQEVLAPGTENTVGAITSIQNFGSIDYWGIDISYEFLPSNNFSLFANVSLLSDDLFDNKELGEENPSAELALNASAFKAKVGIDYLFDSGFSINTFGRYGKGFPVRSGALYGEVESHFIMDLGAGYDLGNLAPGLRFDLMVQNVLNNKHRQFIGAPLIGRMALARLTYQFE